jgi:hypothetical protein
MFRQEANVRARGDGAKRPAQYGRLSGGRGYQSEQHLDRRRLAGAIRAQKAEDLTLSDTQGEVGYSRLIAKFLA